MPVFEGSNRVVLNPEMTPAHAKKCGYKNINTPEDVCNIYKYIAMLIKFCMKEGFPVPIYFARVVTASMLYGADKISDEEYILYYFLDGDPTVVQGMAWYLKNPEHILTSGMSMNEYYPLVEKDVQLTKDNYIKFLAGMSRHKFLTHAVKRKHSWSLWHD